MFKRKVGESLNPSIICSGQNPEFFGVFVGLHGSGFVFFRKTSPGLFSPPHGVGVMWCPVTSTAGIRKSGALVGYGCFQK